MCRVSCACARASDPTFKQITGFFQCTMRSTEAYDQGSKDLIIAEYARLFWWYHQCDPEAIKHILNGIANTMRDT